MDRYTDLEEKLTDAADQLQHDGTEAAQDLQSRAKDAWDSAQQQAQRAVREGSEYVRENRLPSLIGAFAVGLLVGRLFARREADSFSDRYISEPLHRSRDVLTALPLAAVGAMLTQYGRSAVKSVQKAVKR